MAYLVNTDEQRKAMLADIGAASLESLFAPVPASFREPRIDFPPGLPESELLAHLEEIASHNAGSGLISFAGAGCYDHYVPAAVGDLISRGEFLTAYTPYQPEMSQGMLQAIYEFQSLVCRLTGMDASNASLYDGAAAAWEAVSIAARSAAPGIPPRVLVDKSAHPHVRELLKSFCERAGFTVEDLAVRDGAADPAGITGQAACVVAASPNFYGRVADLKALAAATHAAGGKLVALFQPSSLGLLKSPGELGADLAAGDGQGFGTPMQFGGPNLGLLASRNEFLRKLPGRIAGGSCDALGRRGFVLTLQAREQHIRREKSTSSVCTNQALCALAFLIHMSLLGPQGLRRLSRTLLSRAQWLKKEIAGIPGFSLVHKGATFMEFAVKSSKPVSRVMEALRGEGMLGGVPLEGRGEGLEDAFLVAVTEKRSPEQLKSYVQVLKKL